jgi:phenylpyruvate tautomerase PptA (4-oxalocrotonate tautomerase family)
MANFKSNFLTNLFGKGKEKKEGTEAAQVQEAEPVETAIPQESNNGAAEDNELIAVITAALISCLGGRSNIVVRNIRRVDDRTPAWGKVSRTEQMANRF